MFSVAICPHTNASLSACHMQGYYVQGLYATSGTFIYTLHYRCQVLENCPTANYLTHSSLLSMIFIIYAIAGCECGIHVWGTHEKICEV